MDAQRAEPQADFIMDFSTEINILILTGRIFHQECQERHIII